MNRRGTDQPFAFEAKEHVRKMLIGKKVLVVPEYTRTAPAESKDQSTRVYASIIFGKINVSDDLLRKGLARVISHRMDEDRSRFYEFYIQSEQDAARRTVGVHDPKAKGSNTRKAVDLTRRRKRGGKDKDANDDEEKVADNSPVNKARQFLNSFQRESNGIEAVVEYCFSSTRFKLYVPRDHCYITFVLAGVRSPQENKEKKTNWAQEALDMIRPKVTQHNVKIYVEGLDRGDNFIGNMVFGKHNIGCDLLKDGYAELMRYSAEKSKYADKIMAAANKGRAAKVRCWQDFEERMAAIKAARAAAEAEADGVLAAEEAAINASRLKEGSNASVSICEVVDATTFYIHVNGNENKDKIEATMVEFTAARNAGNADADISSEPVEVTADDATPTTDADADAAVDADADVDAAATPAADDAEEKTDAAEATATGETADADGEKKQKKQKKNRFANISVDDDWEPERGEVLAGKFSDNTWHRVRVEGGSDKKGWRVCFIDYGNYDELATSCLLPLPDSVARIPGAAKLCKLAGLSSPSETSEWFEPAAQTFAELAFSKDLKAKVEYIDRNDVAYLTLVDPVENTEKISINVILLRDGLARIVEGRKAGRISAVCDKLQTDEDAAKRNHYGIWEYGDVSDGEDDPNERFGGGRPPKRTV